jgi:hypothetical protein
MLHYKLITMKSQLKIFALIALLGGVVSLSGCDEDPEPENVPEEITRVILTFTPTDLEAAPIVTAIANDPDGDGPIDIVIQPIALKADNTYMLTIQMFNGLLEPTNDDYDITAEIIEEAEEHQLFFSWSTGVFIDPTGTGNIGATGSVNYEDDDDNELPIGLATSWKTVASPSSGSKTFRVVLAHQPDGIKSATSTSSDGEDEVDITFPISINQ